jgi:hypothetical protein
MWPAAQISLVRQYSLNQIFTDPSEYFTLTATLNTAPVGINHTALDAEFKPKLPNGVMGLAVPSLSLSLTMLVVFAVL